MVLPEAKNNLGHYTDFRNRDRVITYRGTNDEEKSLMGCMNTKSSLSTDQSRACSVKDSVPIMCYLDLRMYNEYPSSLGIHSLSSTTSFFINSARASPLKVWVSSVSRHRDESRMDKQEVLYARPTICASSVWLGIAGHGPNPPYSFVSYSYPA